MAEKEVKDVKKAAKPEDAKKQPKEKRNIFQIISRFFKEMRVELKKVVWPTRKQTLKNTWTVIVCCVIVGVCIWIFDAAAGLGVKALIDAFHG